MYVFIRKLCVYDSARGQNNRMTLSLLHLPLLPSCSHYPGNYHSNKRWCCGDMYHL